MFCRPRLLRNIVQVARPSDHSPYSQDFPSLGGLMPILDQGSHLLVACTPPSEDYGSTGSRMK